MPMATRAAAKRGSRMPNLGTGRASCSQTARCRVCSRKPSDSETAETSVDPTGVFWRAFRDRRFGRCLLTGARREMFDSLTVYVLAVIFVATLIRSALGFGEALVAVPLLAFRTPITVAAPLAVLVSVLVAGVIVVQDWRHVQMRSAAGLIITSLLGIPLGILLLVKVNGHVVKLILGAVIVAFSIYSLSGKNRLHLHQDHWVWLTACGFLSGVLGGAYGMNGPPLAVYGSLRRWSPQHFRATLQGYFLPASLAGLVGYLASGVWGLAVTRYFCLSLPAVAVAILLGRVINHRIKDYRFFRSVYVALIGIGGLLMAQSLIP